MTGCGVMLTLHPFFVLRGDPFIASEPQEIRAFSRSFRLTGVPFGRCFRLAAALQRLSPAGGAL